MGLTRCYKTVLFTFIKIYM